MRIGDFLRRRSGASPVRVACTALIVAACGGGDGKSPTGVQTPSISVSLASSALNVAAGGSATSSVTVQRSGGYAGAVTLTVSGQPSTVTASINPQTISSEQTSATITWTAVANATQGSHSVTVNASGSGVSVATATAQLSVVPAAAVASAMERVAGDGQSVQAGALVPVQPRVLVRNQTGQPLAGVVVSFASDTGVSMLVDSVVTTGIDGIATIGSWRPGPGRVVIRANVSSLSPVRFGAMGLGQLSVADTTIGTGGGTIVVKRAGDPLDGLKLSVPSGASTEPLSVTMSYGDTTGIPKRNGVRIVTPVISVSSNSNGFTKKDPYKITIPAKFKKNEWPIVMMFERATGKVVVLPSRTVDTTGVIAVTRHLDASFIDPSPSAAALRSGAFNKESKASWTMGRGVPGAFSPAQNAIADVNPVVQIVIGAVPYDSLMQDLNSEYESSVDDWEFDPVLVYEERDRFFNTLPLASSWYFDHYKAARGPLAMRFREAEGISYSNAQGLRMGAEMSRFIDLGAVGNLFTTLIAGSISTDLYPDSLAMLTIKSGLFLTGRPQMLMGLNQIDTLGATIFLVRRTRANNLDVTLGTRVFGPSGPRTIALQNGKTFEATTWGARDPFTDEFRNFTITDYIPMGQTAGINAKAINALWEKVFAGTAGDDFIPAYHFATHEQSNIKDTIWLAEDTTRVWVECPTCEKGLVPGEGIAPTGKMAAAVRLVRTNGKFVKASDPWVGENGFKIDTLDDGKRMGFVALEFMEDPDLFSYLDWTEAEIRVRRLKVTPDTSTVAVNQTFTLNATYDRALPPGATWEWELGDGRTITGRTNVFTDEYTSLRDGRDTTYNIVARLYSNGALYATGKAKISVKAAAPDWQITSVSDPDSLFTDPDIRPNGDFGKAFLRLLAAPGSGMIAVEDAAPGVQEVRLRIRKSTLWAANQCCPLPAYSAANEHELVVLGISPMRIHALGAFFAGWEIDSWSQSTSNLNSGTMTGQNILGTVSYQIRDRGTQIGPAGGLRINATRNGTTLTGTIFITIWWVDDESGMIETAPQTYRLPFTAKRMK